MALEIAGVALDKLLSIETRESARLVRHDVPGLSGEYAQDMGRSAVRIRFRGILYGTDATDGLKNLRDSFLGRVPVDFVCELTGQGYFSQVLVDHLEVSQKAGGFDEFDFECEVTEYVPPPPPPVVPGFGDLDLGILDEAASMMDDVQNALSAVSGLADLLSGASSFGDPTTRMRGMLDGFKSATTGAPDAIGAIKDLL